MHFQHIFKQIDSIKSVFYAWFEAMHTRIDVVLCHLPENESIEIMAEIYDEIKRIENIADRFNSTSELSYVNRSACLNPVTVSVELLGILKDCIEYNKLSMGAFDITIQSFNKYKQGINDILIDHQNSTVFFKNKNVQLDLCGYIKGYALDKVKVFLVENKCNNALLNFGNSSVCAIGNHPYGIGWKVNLPYQTDRFVTLVDQCLTSSGNSKDHLHIIQPQTGDFGNITEARSVITPNGVSGEVLSTALCVCNVKQYAAICQKLNGKMVECS